MVGMTEESKDDILRDLDALEARVEAEALMARPGHPMLTLQEVADLMGVHPNTVHRWIRLGKLKGYQAGGRKGVWRFHVNDLRALRR
jgi:excisionase family DNA binding protein